MRATLCHSTVSCGPVAVFIPCSRSRRCHRPTKSIAVTVAKATEQPQSISVDKDVVSEPWNFGFQVNERHLTWDDTAARQLIKLVVAQKLNWEMDYVEAKLGELAMLVPDMVGKLERMRADILVQLLQDLPGLTSKLLVLREQLPGINISSLVARWPYIVLDFDAASFTAKMQQMRQQLPGVRVELLVDEEPMLLKADIPTVLQNIRRILPQQDPLSVLVSQPQMVLDMASAGMLSAADVEGSPSI